MRRGTWNLYTVLLLQVKHIWNSHTVKLSQAIYLQMETFLFSPVFKKIWQKISTSNSIHKKWTLVNVSLYQWFYTRVIFKWFWILFKVNIFIPWIWRNIGISAITAFKEINFGKCPEKARSKALLNKKCY